MNKLFFALFIILTMSSSNSNAQTLEPGDGIKLILYHVSESISGEYYIQEDGFISLPFLGKIKASNRNIDSLKSEIYIGYNNLYKNPELSILPIIRINIFGEVRNPGFYYVTGIDRLSDILAKAGGTTSCPRRHLTRTPEQEKNAHPRQPRKSGQPWAEGHNPVGIEQPRAMGARDRAPGLQGWGEGI